MAIHRPGPSHLTCNGRARRRSAWRSLADIVRAASESFHRSRKTSPWTRWRTAHGTQQYLGGVEYLQRGTNIARRTHSAGQWCRNGAADRAGSDARAPRRKRRNLAEEGGVSSTRVGHSLKRQRQRLWQHQLRCNVAATHGRHGGSEVPGAQKCQLLAPSR